MIHLSELFIRAGVLLRPEACAQYTGSLSYGLLDWHFHAGVKVLGWQDLSTYVCCSVHPDPWNLICTYIGNLKT